MTEKKVSNTRWAQILYPAVFNVGSKAVEGRSIIVWDTEDKTYTIRFVPLDFNPKHMFYSGVMEEKLDADGISITKSNFGNICNNIGLRLQPRIDIDPRKVNEYFTLHWGDVIVSDVDGNRKISTTITGRSMVYYDDVGEPKEVTIVGPPAVSLDAARTSMFSKVRKLYPPIHWKRDLLVISVADDIDISVDDDDDDT